MDTLVGQTISSANFRKRYASLTAPTIVTVNGHAIGTWVPGSDPLIRTAQVGDDFVQNRQTTQVSATRSGDTNRPAERVEDRLAWAKSATPQFQRDTILNRINKGG